jgi:hypothetical protein
MTNQFVLAPDFPVSTNPGQGAIPAKASYYRDTPKEPVSPFGPSFGWELDLPIYEWGTSPRMTGTSLPNRGPSMLGYHGLPLAEEGA